MNIQTTALSTGNVVFMKYSHLSLEVCKGKRWSLLAADLAIMDQPMVDSPAGPDEDSVVPMEFGLVVTVRSIESVRLGFNE